MIKKFRVWDKLAKIFIYPDRGYQGHYFIDLNGRFHNFQDGSGGDEYVIQQYTGLQDSENREIYEGDIVYAGLKSNGAFARTFEVKFNQGAFNVGNPSELYSLACDYTVKGNIFQTPELLEKC